MGCGSSTVLQPVQDAQTLEFDRLMEEEKAEAQLHFKLLCLGAGESGKSTIIKQLVFLHKQQVVSDEEKQAYVRVLHGNVLTCISTLLKEAADFAYEMDETAQRHAEIVDAFDSRMLLTPEVVESIEYLWLHTPAIAATYARRNEFWILDGSEWYIKNMWRFIEDDYRPNEEDMIMARKRTTGVVETQLKYGSVAWSVVDVGGQRSERRKWLNCFENAKGILYTVNLAGYCSVLFEDQSVNRMQESLKLFEDTMANPLFAETPVFLILNKKDLFEQLIETKPLTMAFPEYTGPQQLRPCIEYIAQQFASRLPPAHSKPMVLLMAARVKKDVQFCFEDVKDTLLDANRKGIKRAQAKLDALREQYRNEQLKEMEATAKAKADQARLAQEQAHLEELKAQNAQQNPPLSQLPPNDGHARSNPNNQRAHNESKPETVPEAAETEAEAEAEEVQSQPLLPAHADKETNGAAIAVPAAAALTTDAGIVEPKSGDAHALSPPGTVDSARIDSVDGAKSDDRALRTHSDSPAIVASQTQMAQQ